MSFAERAVRLVFESGRPIAPVARDLGVKHESLRSRGCARPRPMRGLREVGPALPWPKES